MKANAIKYIVIHCTAGFSDVKAIKRFWFDVKKWKTGGYCRIIDLEGKTHELYPLGTRTNGVRGYNTECIHIAYIGGVKKDNYKIAEDTRTTDQKDALTKNIIEAMAWIVNNGGNIDKVKIVGHRDFSPDQNGNGKIESWERIKECPSFEVKEDYKWLQP